jgi:hypothetical protein
METTFWTAILIYYASLIGAITVQPAIIFVTAAIFFTTPSLTEAELIPGMRDSLNTQLDILETQMWLSREGYYENIQ